MAFIDNRPFNQCGDFVQQCFRHQDLVAIGFFQQHRTDTFLAVFEAGDDFAFSFKLAGVCVCICDFDVTL